MRLLWIVHAAQGMGTDGCAEEDAIIDDEEGKITEIHSCYDVNISRRQRIAAAIHPVLFDLVFTRFTAYLTLLTHF